MFHKGQRVVCVDDSINPIYGPNSLKSGDVYTVAWCGVWWDGIAVCVCEVTQTAEVPFRYERFRPVIERKTDISIFTAMLKPKVRELTGCGNE
jgi:hypothetical protein